VARGQPLEVQATEHPWVWSGKRVQEERTGQNLAVSNGLRDHNGDSVNQQGKLHEKLCSVELCENSKRKETAQG